MSLLFLFQWSLAFVTENWETLFRSMPKRTAFLLFEATVDMEFTSFFIQHPMYPTMPVSTVQRFGICCPFSQPIFIHTFDRNYYFILINLLAVIGRPPHPPNVYLLKYSTCSCIYLAHITVQSMAVWLLWGRWGSYSVTQALSSSTYSFQGHFGSCPSNL